MINLTKFARRKYIDGPTPLEFLPRLSKWLDGPDIFIKRDDMLPFTGGNKVRKLEYVMEEAKSQGYDTLITGATIHSNHCRVVLATAAVEKLPVHLVLSEKTPGSYDSGSGGNNFLFKLFGAKSVTVVPNEEAETEVMEKLANELRAKGHVPMVMSGSTAEASSSLGYVRLGEEILSQCREMGIQPHHIIVPSGSGATHAGLVSAMLGNHCSAKVHGVCVRRNAVLQKTRVETVIKDIFSLIFHEETKPVVKDGDVLVYDQYYGAMHGAVTEEMLLAVKMTAQLEGVLLDPIYTGKAMAGLMDLVKKGKMKKEENVVFVHTGGLPNLYVYTNSFEKVLDTMVVSKLDAK